MEKPQPTEEKLRAAGIVVRDDYARRRLYVINNTSPSQWSTYDQCNRKWFWDSIAGLKGDDAPHQKRGTHVDLELQHYVASKGEVRVDSTVTVDATKNDQPIKRTENWSAMIAEVAKHLPDPRKVEIATQVHAEVATYDGGPMCVVKPDFVYEREPGWLALDDLKTTSDFTYCKSAAQLVEDVQIGLAYPRWAFEVAGAERVSIAHIYGRTKWDYKKDAPAPPRAHRSTRPHAYVDEFSCRCPECRAWLEAANRGKPLPSPPIFVAREALEGRWQRQMQKQREMVTIARAAESALQLPPNLEKCDEMYGRPCPHRDRCGIKNAGLASALGRARKERETMETPESPLMKKLRERQNGAAVQSIPAPAAEEKPAAEAPVLGSAAPTLKERLAARARAQQAAQTPAADEKPAEVPVAAAPAPSYGFCAGCGTKLDGNNASKLPSGEVKHLGCPSAAPAADAGGAGSQVLPPETRNDRTSTSEEVAAAEAKPKRGKAKPKGGIMIQCGVGGCEEMHPSDKVDEHRASHAPAETEGQAVAGSEDLSEEALAIFQQAGLSDDEVIKLVDEKGVGGALVIARAAIEDGKKAAAAKHQAEKVEAYHERAVANGAGLSSLDPAAELAALLKEKNEQVKRPKRAPILYIDCVPDAGGVSPDTFSHPVPLEVWLAPIAELAARAYVNEKGQADPVADWRLIQYRSRGVLAVAIRAAIESCPPALLIDSRSSGAEVAIEVLTPYAALRVRGVR